MARAMSLQWEQLIIRREIMGKEQITAATVLMCELRAVGFSDVRVDSTGGNCTAVIITLPSGQGEIYIADEFSALHEPGEHVQWEAFHYPAGSDDGPDALYSESDDVAEDCEADSKACAKALAEWWKRSVDAAEELTWEALEVGDTRGYDDANYADMYGGDTDADPEIPERFASVATYYAAAYEEGVERYWQEQGDRG